MFSIIIPSYNRQEYIADLLKSLECQTVHNFEVIIVDDCSTQSVEIKQFYSFPLKIIRNSVNQGAAKSRNIGANVAEKEWLLFLDDDDRFALEKCEILAHKISQDPRVNFIYHPAECIMVNEHFSYFTRPFTDIADITLDNLLRANKIGGMPMIAVKKSLFLSVNGLSDELLSLEDYEFLLKLVTNKNFKPCYVDNALTKCAFYTQRASVSTNTENTEKAIQAIAKKYVKTAQQQRNFTFNSLYMLSYTHMMNLSRKAGVFYLRMFCGSFNLKYLAIALITFISPKLAINMKRYF
ncbi:glycosyltransferase [Bibersteinia trehalosi USDA-ARS-USMARC-188]|uniref:Glycosyltransferase n=4 Tax=Bibersteinia trehalosi TaxID=47735 RepID=W0RBR4_BIBTR|nr:glycosyltransferase family 2 protein [Bibersteinia trehalosi]AGH38842.1 glycosyltransferase [Bibersteinia trehalosi USDA-ARS-USMARC-192]AHG81359.1 glycosyltransferase [Bibersteinia trehalosi USDA-ARS-USMARC-188]AHG83623.1 glycosyltransferase [Bibersteinia trehalosi USDA-ARS-USMARC-189]AHG86828.1 glycosyltransferase [Bibersteinia trehalosi USDA-ARS-USMARC-190]RRN04499.1 glycosyltransferase family 2 protein [Bibersteinia trehalosi]